MAARIWSIWPQANDASRTARNYTPQPQTSHFVELGQNRRPAQRPFRSPRCRKLFARVPGRRDLRCKHHT
jgi:hypothetical protein